MENSQLKKRIIDISYKYKLSHLGSCLTSVDIIKRIYDIKKPDEKFVLSCGHAGLALYVVIESMGGRNAEETYNHHGVHPDKCSECGLDFSTGSLGQGLPAALGMALADRTKNAYCLISDGECTEGSVVESLRIKEELKLNNLKIYLNFNGWAAYRQVKLMDLPKGIDFVVSTDFSSFPFLNGQDSHYKVLTKDEYETYFC